MHAANYNLLQKQMKNTTVIIIIIAVTVTVVMMTVMMMTVDLLVARLTSLEFEVVISSVRKSSVIIFYRYSLRFKLHKTKHILSYSSVSTCSCAVAFIAMIICNRIHGQEMELIINYYWSCKLNNTCTMYSLIIIIASKQ